MSLVEASDPPSPSEGMTGLMIVPRYDEGDTKIEWNKNKVTETDAAKKHFLDLKAQGYRAYRVDPKNGDKGEQIKEFDPNAEKIVMIPPFAGG